ncbi:hypothetical protein [Roseivirga sp. E12]|uniref:hypothetical protein n=1 Tax=Roseivirga sp. E12 TaxID=2819237 RepID=UPI001ABC0A50|nr:hypothetical protein [Roseivirga sp. E12]MBO3697304.1 hypothetical protein [Roseivirga sp. E12]
MEGELKNNIPETDLDQYIIVHYNHLLSLKEHAAYKHHITTLKAENSSEQFGEMMLRKWGTKDSEALQLLEGGYDKFKKQVSNRVLREERDKVFINNCPKCRKLARTPQAKQCRFCGHDWH